MGHFGGRRSSFMTKVSKKVAEITPEETKGGELEKIVVDQQAKQILPYGRQRITPEMQARIDAREEFLKSDRSLNKLSNEVKSPPYNAVISKTPSLIDKEVPVLKTDENPKKSNTGLIFGAVALGVVTYLYTQE
jgi:hypothetical protein